MLAAARDLSSLAESDDSRPVVLVVEDEVLVRMVIAEYLRDCEYVVIEAGSALEAIALFKEGVSGNFDQAAQLTHFRRVAARHPVLTRQLINYLLALSLADGVLSENEEQFLRTVASELGISNTLFEQLLRMVRAQSHFGRGGEGSAGGPRQPAGRNELALAYEALGVDESISDANLKKAYRRLMSENHPDKMVARGLPESMLEVAKQKTQAIQAAWERVREARGMR